MEIWLFTEDDYFSRMMASLHNALETTSRTGDVANDQLLG